MRSSEKIILKKGEWLEYFIDIIFLMSLAAGFTLYMVIDIGITNYIYFMLVFISFTFYLGWYEWSSLFYQEFLAELTDEQFKRAITVTANELNWGINTLEKDYCLAFSLTEFIEDSHIQISIKKTKCKVFINSIRTPKEGRLFSSKKSCRNNVDTFLFNTAHILKGANVEQIVTDRIEKEKNDFWQESEWTLFNIFTRFIGYTFAILFILLSLWFIRSGDLIYALIGIGLICFSCAYFFIDIKVILEKRARRNT